MIFLREHWFEAASEIQARLGPIVVRADGIKNERKARQYIASVLGILRALEGATRTGNAVITMIRFHNKPVLIFPYDGQGGPCNAWAKRDWGLFTGTVSFTPFVGGGCRGPRGTYPVAKLPHELLVHELTHIVRAVSGNWMKVGEEDEEELANMVANIFSVEINRRPRLDYIHDDTEVTGDLAVFSREYHDEHFEMIEAFCRQNKHFAIKLARVKTAFNPVFQFIDATRPPEWSGR